MKQAAVVFAFVALAVGCGTGSGNSPPACVSGQSCVPSGVANACTVYVTSCDSATGVQSCVASGQLADGAVCGSGKVCLSATCIAACVPGLTCSPTGVPDSCKTYATACSDKLTSTSCAVGGNQPDGTVCGSGLVCSAGGCVTACTSGAACVPEVTPDPCRTYATTCSSTLAQAACAPSGNAPDGTACGASSTCQSGVCLGVLAAPTLSPAGGTGSPGLVVTIVGPDPASTIYYTTDGSPPSEDPATLSSSFTGRGTVVLQATAVVQAFARLGLQKSPTVVGVYTITSPPPTPVGINLGSGFTPGSVQTNGVATFEGTRLQLVPSALFQVASAFYPQALNVQTFTTDFSFQIVDPVADGLTFTIQGIGPYAMGSQGGGLGYGPDPFDSQRVLAIDRSVAVKFDIYDNEGEGWNSTGLFTNGHVPTVPAVDLTPSGINLRSGRVLDAHIVYDGLMLTLTLTDRSTTPATTFTTTFAVDVPAVVGGVTGYVGFTAGTGNRTGTHQIINWTYSNRR